MPIISIYNNKGGVGKSTLTVGLAEFLAGHRKRKVLVIDFDAQASSSGAILGRECVPRAIDAERTVVRLADEVIRSRRPPADLSRFVTARPASGSRGSALGRIDVLVPDKPNLLDLEERMSHADVSTLRDHLRPALAAYEIVLIDLAGNIDRRNRLSVAALAMSDFVVIPVEHSQITLNALPDTFDLIHHARGFASGGRPAVAGLVLNKADRRTEQYRSKFPHILEAADRGELPPVFDNVVPDTSNLVTATDDTRDFGTLKERFDTNYDHVRKVAQELEDRCQKHVFDKANGSPERYGQWFRSWFGTLSSRRRKAARTVKS
jgi:chromosome partitioning protein